MNKHGQFDMFDLFSPLEAEMDAPPVAQEASKTPVIAPEPIFEPVAEAIAEVTTAPDEVPAVTDSVPEIPFETTNAADQANEAPSSPQAGIDHAIAQEPAAEIVDDQQAAAEAISVIEPISESIAGEINTAEQDSTTLSETTIAAVEATVTETIVEVAAEDTRATDESSVDTDAVPSVGSEAEHAIEPASDESNDTKVEKTRKTKKTDAPLNAEMPTEAPVIFTLMSASNHPLTIQELTVGDPERRKGYLGKHRGMWLNVLMPANTFNRLSDNAKSDMRERLRAELESNFNA
ncbi:MAG: hypothetical protein RSD49_01585 [Hafnia sp.]